MADNPTTAATAMAIRLSRTQFEDLAAEAVDRLPDELARLLDNVAVTVGEEPPTS